MHSVISLIILVPKSLKLLLSFSSVLLFIRQLKQLVPLSSLLRIKIFLYLSKRILVNVFINIQLLVSIQSFTSLTARNYCNGSYFLFCGFIIFKIDEHKSSPGSIVFSLIKSILSFICFSYEPSSFNTVLFSLEIFYLYLSSSISFILFIYIYLFNYIKWD